MLLDGQSYLWAAGDQQAFASPADNGPDDFSRTRQALFYQARSKRTGEMWDTWLFIEKGTWHLFYLAKSGQNWDNISLATSSDGVHWLEYGRLLRKARGVTWMGTGSTWRAPDFDRNKTYVLNFSEWRGPRQTIFFATSPDLLHWTRLGDDCQFVQDERWYERDGRWDCIWTMPRPDGQGLYGYWTATPKKESGGQFGFGESRDGIHWQALPPPKVLDLGSGEVGAIAERAGRYYMLFGHYPTMQTLVANQPAGPFVAAKKNLTLLDKHTYFCRFLPLGDQLLVNHHSMSVNRGVFFAPLKMANIDSEGTLRLAWWPGNDRAKHQAVDVQLGTSSRSMTLFANRFDVAESIILEGTIRLPADATDQRGLYVDCGAGQGVAILLDGAGRAKLGAMRTDGSSFAAEKQIDREWTFPPITRFRLLVHLSLIEVYLDDILIDCYSLPRDASGQLGLIGPRSAFDQLRAWSSGVN